MLACLWHIVMNLINSSSIIITSNFILIVIITLLINSISIITSIVSLIIIIIIIARRVWLGYLGNHVLGSVGSGRRGFLITFAALF